MAPFRVLVVLFVLSLLVAAGITPVAASDDPNAAVRLALQAELEDFSVPGWQDAQAPQPGPALVRYQGRLAEVAGDPSWKPRVRTGSLPLVRPGTPALALGINVIEPEVPSRGTLLFVHGYMSHAANFAYTFREFSRLGWTVVTLDLPGHGLSTGPRADVVTFADYGDAVQFWLEWAFRTGPPGPRVLMAHSLGSAASFEALRRPGAPRPDRIVFCAPLLRPDWYPVLTFGERALGWWLKTMPSTFGWDGYLDGYTMPVHWFTALDRWLESLTSQTPVTLPLTIYSGDRDEVVDEGWNRDMYRKLVPSARYLVLPGEGHLFLTDAASRQKAQKRIAGDLGLTPLRPPE